jgi:uncharacterized protein
MQKVALEIVALSHSITQSQSYAVVLGEVDGLRRLPIVIGEFEAQAIAVALEKMAPSRPLTHDLMKNVFNIFEIELHEVIINDLQEGIFYAKLLCSNPKETVEIDSRTSDAIALAVRTGCPIYTYEHIIENAGIVMHEMDADTNKPAVTSTTIDESQNLKNMTLVELQKLLAEVLDHEDYIKAASIRDEINRR